MRHAKTMVGASLGGALLLVLAPLTASAAGNANAHGAIADSPAVRGALRTPAHPFGPGAPASNFAVVPSSDTSADIAGGVNVGPPTTATTASIPTATFVTGTATTSDGAATLVSTGNGFLTVIGAPGSASPTVNSAIDVSQFTGEGGPGYNVYTYGVALTPDGTAGLATADSQGAIALTRQGNSFAVDASVQSPGLNQAGSPHQPGWIEAPTTSPTASLFDGVVISQTKGNDGHYRGLLMDAQDSTIAVVTGLGTSGAKVAGEVTDPAIVDNSTMGYQGNDDWGTGGMAFSPTNADWAVTVTQNGFAVVNLSDPTHPTIGAENVIPATAGNGAQSIAVAPDGDHVIVAVNNMLYVYSGLASSGGASAIRHDALTLGPTIAMPGSVYSVAVTQSGNLAVNYQKGVSGAALAVVTGIETAAPTYNGATDLTLSGQPSDVNGMSVLPPVAAPPGYWLAGTDGGVYAFGASKFYGSAGALTLAQPVVGMSPTVDSRGYVLAAADGGIFNYGTSKFYGSVPGAGVHVRNVVGIATDPATGGYWLVGSDGGLYSFNAPFHGSLPGLGVAVSNIVGIASTPDGGGYFLVGADGAVYAFGDAVFHGSMGGRPLNKPVVGMAVDPATGGYWLTAGDGGIFAFDAPFFGSTGNIVLNKPVVAMAATPSGQGYWFAASDGGMFSYGDALYAGSLPGLGVTPNKPMIAMGAFS